jgi:hypothetical protein
VQPLGQKLLEPAACFIVEIGDAGDASHVEACRLAFALDESSQGC